MKKISTYLFNLLLLLVVFLLSSCSGEKKEEISEEKSNVPANEEPVFKTVDIKEWPVPWEDTRPRDPAVAQDGKVWFCGQAGNYIGSFNPDTEEFKRYGVEERTHPHNLIVDNEGYVWYAGNQNAHIGKLDPSDGSITKYPMPDPEARDPHTLVFNREGNIWFTVQGGNFVGFLNTTSGDVRLVPVPTKNARPYGIKMDSQDRPWIALFGTYKLATVDPRNFELSEIELPNEDSRPRRLEINSEDKIFFVDYTRGYVGKYDPGSDRFTEWALPGGKDSRPYGTALDEEDRMWIAEAGLSPNRLVGFDTKSEQFVSRTEVPSGGGVIRYMYYEPNNDEVWFGTDTNNVGRAKVN